MQLFRRLSGNIFFKIILALVAISFVFFGVSGFILGTPNSWVAKIGSSSVSYSAFNKALKSDREIITASAKSEEVLRYLDSSKFKSEVLGRLVNKIMIEKLTDDLGIIADRNIILKTIAKDPNFRNNLGKFDRKKFKNFLKKNGLNEERYVNEIATEVNAAMILQTIALAAPLNDQLVLETETFKNETRIADVITISEKNVKSNIRPSNKQLEDFFSKNKQRYAVEEMRKVSYLRFSKKDFADNFKVSNKEAYAEYEKNKEQFLTPESRNFYHILFEEEDSAKDFLHKINKTDGKNNSNIEEKFAVLAKKLQQKDLKAITLSNITKKDLIPQLSNAAFSLKLGQNSDVLESPLGFHIFLLTEVKESQLIPFSNVKNRIKKSLAKDRGDRFLQKKISEIDDLLLTSNSLQKVSKKFNLKLRSVAKINLSGQNERGTKISKIKNLNHFAENAFSISEGQSSKIFYTQNSKEFYALRVEKIFPARERALSEVKLQVRKDLIKSEKRKIIKNLAQKIGEKIEKNPGSISRIAAKYGVSFERNRKFPRSFYANFQGRAIAFQSQFLKDLFDIKIGQSTPISSEREGEFTIGVLKKIKKARISSDQLLVAKNQAKENVRNEIMQGYNAYLIKKYPVKVNEKIFGQKDGRL